MSRDFLEGAVTTERFILMIVKNDSAMFHAEDLMGFFSYLCVLFQISWQR